MKTIFKALILAVTILATSVTVSLACACGLSCAVVKPTADGFVALREEPNASSKMILKLKPYDIVGVEFCGDCPEFSETAPWYQIACVPRVDGWCDSQNDKITVGWSFGKLLEVTSCPYGITPG